jgi:hypothetical protein
VARNLGLEGSNNRLLKRRRCHFPLDGAPDLDWRPRRSGGSGHTGGWTVDPHRRRPGWSGRRYQLGRRPGRHGLRAGDLGDHDAAASYPQDLTPITVARCFRRSGEHSRRGLGARWRRHGQRCHAARWSATHPGNPDEGAGPTAPRTGVIGHRSTGKSSARLGPIPSGLMSTDAGLRRSRYVRPRRNPRVLRFAGDALLGRRCGLAIIE